jgi:ribonucleoside-triphosphate reductase
MNTINKYLYDKNNWKVKENSNMDFSLQGLNNYLSTDKVKNFWLNEVYTPEIKKAHTKGDIHIHDLGHLAVYCMGWDLYDILKKGFRGVKNKIECNPPNYFRTALGQIVNFFYTLQGEAAGAIALSNFDTLLAPFIFNENLTYKEVKQSMQEFIFNLNIPTRVGFQTPFTNLSFDLTVSDIFKDMGVKIGNKNLGITYKHLQGQMDLINKAFAEIMMEGDAKGRIFTFPIPTYNITKDFDWRFKSFDPIWKMTAKYGIPYFANFVNSDMSPEDTRSMCCRLRLDKKELVRRGGGLFGANAMTGSIGVVTINLPKIAFELSKTCLSTYEITHHNIIRYLGYHLEIAKKSLEIKRKKLEHYTELGLYPYTKYFLQDVKKEQGSYWNNHFSTIGIIGMNEMLDIFGKDFGSIKYKKLTTEILKGIQRRLSYFQEETGNLYNLEATPAEGTSYRLAMLDKKEFNHNYDYYTNSTHLPVGYTDDIFEVLEHQDQLQKQYSGGTVLHIYTGEAFQSTMISAVKNLVKKVAHNYTLPYFTITPTFSICPNHKYISGEHPECPKCGEECEVYSRVVGYYRPVSSWNIGKQKEFKERKYFKMGD